MLSLGVAWELQTVGWQHGADNGEGRYCCWHCGASGAGVRVYLWVAPCFQEGMYNSSLPACQRFRQGALGLQHVSVFSFGCG